MHSRPSRWDSLALPLHLHSLHSLSVKGLDHLELLERLNLYGNQIASLEVTLLLFSPRPSSYPRIFCSQELARLGANKQLKELDLRLNPVTRTEPFYRLFVVHLLPSLMRLDDMDVRAEERGKTMFHHSIHHYLLLVSCWFAHC